MSTFQERIKVFRELPILKAQLEEIKLKLGSLEKIKNSVSGENYLSLRINYEKQISELTQSIEELQAGIILIKNEIELDSKVLESEYAIVEKELQEMQFLYERGALSKQDYTSKHNLFKKKNSRNKSLLSKNQSYNKALEFYSTHVGIETYGGHSYSTLLGSLKTMLPDIGNSFRGLLLNIPSFIKTKVFFSIVSILIILLIVIKIFGSSGTIKIGDQIWATKNLDIDHYRNGDSIPQVKDEVAWANLESGAWCYYENNSKIGKTYGKLYNWYALNDPRGLTPKGWHIPNNDEWTSLENKLGGNVIAGGRLKETGTKKWHSPNIGATNESGFSGLPGGYRKADGTFYNIGSYGYWWSSTETNTHKAWYWSMGYDYSSVYRKGYNEASGFSVRCVRDY